MPVKARKKIIPGIDEQVDAMRRTRATRENGTINRTMREIIEADPELMALVEERMRTVNRQANGDPLWKQYQSPEVQYNEELGLIILDLVAAGLSLAKICMRPGMPASSSVCKWVVRYEAFGKAYARACVMKAQVWADEILDIADDASNDWEEVTDEEGRTTIKPNFDHMKRSQLRVETRKWYLSKILPKQFGDATLLKLADNDGNKLNMQPPPLIIRGISARNRKIEG
jgi:hypothetical protein